MRQTVKFKKNISRLFITFLFLNFSINFCYADNLANSTSSEIESTVSNGWFLGAGLGLMYPTLGHSVNYAYSGMPGFPDDEYVTEDVSKPLNLSILGGYQWQRNSDCFPGFSLDVNYSYSSPTFNGVIYINSLPELKNFTFKYNLKQQLIMLNLKVDLYRWHKFMLYGLVGGGLAINNVTDYSNSPIPGATSFNKRYGFTSANTTQFASNLGAGIDYSVNKKVQLSLGYLYTDSGNIETGDGQGVLASNHLVNKLRSSTVDIQARYFF